MSDERQRNRDPEDRQGPVGLGNPFQVGGENGDGTMATVSAGIHMERLPIAGRTIGEIRREFGSRWDLHPNSLAYINGNGVADDTVLGAGQVLMFGMRSGEKGAA